jgi:serine/threonine-protein kinase
LNLEPGRTLLHYEITEKIGEGGMGEVYRATDTKLGREVAIKLLPPEVANDADRLARFRREAQLLASLNHPNVAAIYGLEEAGEARFLVLELVDGVDLAERLTRGPLPVDQALDVAQQIATALEVAHEHGIVHRDLKPANVKLTTDGKVKVLDFGLAKATDPGPAGDVNPSMSPTLTTASTQAGVILGTAAYMSPEQARGSVVDKRADIWSFGCVLLELVTGRNPFLEGTITDTLASVLRSEPDWQSLPRDVSPAMRQLLGRCLEKDPTRRLRDIGEARIAIDRIRSGDVEEAEPANAQEELHRQGVALWKAIVAVAVAVLATAALLKQDRTPEEPPTTRRFEVITGTFGQDRLLARRRALGAPTRPARAETSGRHRGRIRTRLVAGFRVHRVLGPGPATGRRHHELGDDHADAQLRGRRSHVELCLDA